MRFSFFAALFAATNALSLTAESDCLPAVQGDWEGSTAAQVDCASEAAIDATSTWG